MTEQLGEKLYSAIYPDTTSEGEPSEGALRVCWVPQVPGEAFYVRVGSLMEAKKLIQVLAEYDQFQLANNIKPDYCNAGGLSVFEDGEWCDWTNADGDDIDSLGYSELTTS